MYLPCAKHTAAPPPADGSALEPAGGHVLRVEGVAAQARVRCTTCQRSYGWKKRHEFVYNECKGDATERALRQIDRDHFSVDMRDGVPFGVRCMRCDWTCLWHRKAQALPIHVRRCIA